MVEYICERCGYNTHRKSCIVQHYKRKNACPSIICDVSTEDMLKKIEGSSNDIDGYICERCEKVFKYSFTKTRHQKQCKLHSEQSKDEILNNLITEIRELKEKIEKQPVTNVTNNNINTININNSVRIKYVKNAIFSNIDKSSIVRVDNGHLKYSDFMIDCLIRKENGIVDIIKKVYFNEDHPENCVMSMDSQDLEENTMKIYDGKDWFQEMWANVVNPFMAIWCKVLYKCYEQHSDEIQEKFMKDESDESFREAMNKRLAVEDFLAYIESNDSVKEHIRQCIAEHFPTVKKIHGYTPYATIE